MSRTEHDLWTLALAVDCLDHASQLEAKTLPATITNFDKGFVKGFKVSGYGSVSPQVIMIVISRGEGGSGGTLVGSIPPPPPDVP